MHSCQSNYLQQVIVCMDTAEHPMRSQQREHQTHFYAIDENAFLWHNLEQCSFYGNSSVFYASNWIEKSIFYQNQLNKSNYDGEQFTVVLIYKSVWYGCTQVKCFLSICRIIDLMNFSPSFSSFFTRLFPFIYTYEINM